jgi:hypothetical protein
VTVRRLSGRGTACLTHTHIAAAVNNGRVGLAGPVTGQRQPARPACPATLVVPLRGGTPPVDGPAAHGEHDSTKSRFDLLNPGPAQKLRGLAYRRVVTGRVGQLGPRGRSRGQLGNARLGLPGAVLRLDHHHGQLASPDGGYVHCGLRHGAPGRCAGSRAGLCASLIA